MWTEEHRRTYRRGGDGYPSDLRDAEWARLEPLIPHASPGGRPRKTDLRSAMNAILAFVEREGARLLGSVCDSPGDQCTATAWRGGRLYVMTAWREGHRPIDPLAPVKENRESQVQRS